MKHLIIVLLAALVTLAIVFAIYRPDLLEDAWLWLVGLMGPIIGGIQELIKGIKKYAKQLSSAFDSSTE